VREISHGFGTCGPWLGSRYKSLERLGRNLVTPLAQGGVLFMN